MNEFVVSLKELVVFSFPLHTAAIFPILYPNSKILKLRMGQLTLNVTGKHKLKLVDLLSAETRNPILLKSYYTDADILLYARVFAALCIAVCWALIAYISFIRNDSDSMVLTGFILDVLIVFFSVAAWQRGGLIKDNIEFLYES